MPASCAAGDVQLCTRLDQPRMAWANFSSWTRLGMHKGLHKVHLAH